MYFTYPFPPISGYTLLTFPHQQQAVLYLPFSTNNRLYFTDPSPSTTGCTLITLPHQRQAVLYLPFTTNNRLYLNYRSPTIISCTVSPFLLKTSSSLLNTFQFHLHQVEHMYIIISTFTRLDIFYPESIPTDCTVHTLPVLPPTCCTFFTTTAPTDCACMQHQHPFTPGTGCISSTLSPFSRLYLFCPYHLKQVRHILPLTLITGSTCT
jgi:hypothetical protein